MNTFTSASVIIPSYKGSHKFPNTLKALEMQTFGNFEVILVVDSSADDSLEVLGRTSTKLNITIVDRPNQGRSVTRNTGAAVATRELLIFFDDDTRPEPDCVAKHILHHQHAQNSILVGAVPEDYSLMKTDFQQYKAYLSRKWTTPLEKVEGPLPEARLFLTAANFSISAHSFQQLGGFDDQLTDAEDFDLAIRAFQHGISIYFNARAIAWHDDFITCQSYIKRLQQYKSANQHLYLIKPQLYAQYPRYQRTSVNRAKRLFYSSFAQKYWIQLIDASLLHWILPRKVRYKIYDFVTTGYSL